MEFIFKIFIYSIDMLIHISLTLLTKNKKIKTLK